MASIKTISSADHPEPVQGHRMPAAYLIVESQITDPERFKAYMAAAPLAAREFNAEYLVRGGRMAVLEGDWHPPRLTVLRYPSLEAAQAMYDSPAYVQARALRAGATALFNMVVVEGVESAP
jgi:uncharacterized protein (DUF1330 family)